MAKSTLNTSRSCLVNPFSFFHVVENRSADFRRLIRRYRKERGDPENSKSMDDALKLVDTVETLCRRGKQLQAEEAIELSEYVEILIEVLAGKLDSFLAS